MSHRFVSIAVIAIATATAFGCNTPPIEAPPAPAETAAADGSALQAPDQVADPAEVDPSTAPVADGSGAPAAAADGDADAATPPTGARALPGTVWEPAGDGAQWARLEFTERFMSATDSSGRTLTMPADYSASHTACLGYEGCVLTTTPDNQAVPWPLATQDEYLLHVDCRALAELATEGLTPDAIEAQLGGAVVARTATGICFNPGLIPYTQVPR